MQDPLETLSPDLKTRTRQLLINRPRHMTMKKINTDTDLPVYWLVKFETGASNGPDVTRVQKLFEYLSGRTLFDLRGR